MKRYRIAVIPGDGVGKEVIPAGQRVLEAAVAGHAELEWTELPWGSDYYRQTGAMMPHHTPCQPLITVGVATRVTYPVPTTMPLGSPGAPSSGSPAGRAHFNEPAPECLRAVEQQPHHAILHVDRVSPYP